MKIVAAKVLFCVLALLGAAQARNFYVQADEVTPAQSAFASNLDAMLCALFVGERAANRGFSPDFDPSSQPPCLQDEAVDVYPGSLLLPFDPAAAEPESEPDPVLIRFPFSFSFDVDTEADVAQEASDGVAVLRSVLEDAYQLQLASGVDGLWDGLGYVFEYRLAAADWQVESWQTGDWQALTSELMLDPAMLTFDEPSFDTTPETCLDVRSGAAMADMTPESLDAFDAPPLDDSADTQCFVVHVAAYVEVALRLRISRFDADIASQAPRLRPQAFVLQPDTIPEGNLYLFPTD